MSISVTNYNSSVSHAKDVRKPVQTVVTTPKHNVDPTTLIASGLVGVGVLSFMTAFMTKGRNHVKGINYLA